MFVILAFVTVGVLWLAIVIANLVIEPKSIGARDGKLMPCPKSPNAVGSQCEGAQHAVPPLRFDVSPDVAWNQLLPIVTRLPRCSIVERNETYLHAVVRSKLLRFADDIEFLLDRDANVIHFRSASRVGYSDLGVNRTRMEQIRRDFEPN